MKQDRQQDRQEIRDKPAFQDIPVPGKHDCGGKILADPVEAACPVAQKKKDQHTDQVHGTVPVDHQAVYSDDDSVTGFIFNSDYKMYTSFSFLNILSVSRKIKLFKLSFFISWMCTMYTSYFYAILPPAFSTK